ncbi:putative DNA binding protein [Corchorus capsularis]|uniref:Putative DNA binding protein n=1 Tax=Corchorus capsularis TaxID=210143 RepID=A0A1R3IW92_COCAP|nr:putative DNA binding protein [Corchorus capsularis]
MGWATNSTSLQIRNARSHGPNNDTFGNGLHKTYGPRMLVAGEAVPVVVVVLTMSLCLGRDRRQRTYHAC